MYDLHGIIFAYSASPELGELVRRRTAASIPFCGRYRLIDFALSSMMNAGIRDVGVIMQRDYQSLLDHIGSGKAWDMSRKSGGLRMLPPFGLPDYHRGNYSGTMEAINAVSAYIKHIPQQHIVMMLGNLCANIDLDAAIAKYFASGVDMMAICADHDPDGLHHRYLVGEDGIVTRVLFDRFGGGEGIPSLEGFIVRRDTLLALMDKCRAREMHRFHKDAVALYLNEGGRMGTYIHQGYASAIRTVQEYYNANMDMLDPEKRSQIFPESRPVRTRNMEGVSTYYGEDAVSVNSLVADNCIIEGSIENCIVFSGARIGKGAKLKNCIIMRGCTVGEGTELSCVISDKLAVFGAGVTLTGSPRLPIVVPKGGTI